MKLFRRKSPAATRAHHFGGEGVSKDSPLPLAYKFKLDLAVSVSYRPNPVIEVFC